MKLRQAVATHILTVIGTLAVAGCEGALEGGGDGEQETVTEVASALHIERLGMAQLGRFNSGAPLDEAAVEITAWDPGNKRLFTTNMFSDSIDVIDLANPTAPVRIASLPAGGNPNSVAVHRRVLAVAAEDPTSKTEPGQVRFIDTVTLAHITDVDVGALPDMLTFTSDGRFLLVANEGEPNDDYSVDPEGSVSIIDMRRGPRALTASAVRTVTFNGRIPRRNASSIRVSGPNATFAQDMEPEYIAVSPDGRRAWVTLQENNAIAELDILRRRFVRIVGLGFKNHREPRNGPDASDKDAPGTFRNWPILGMYMPDGIDTFEALGQTLLITANEGDTREYDAFQDVKRLKNVPIDPRHPASRLTADDQLGRLNILTTDGDTDRDGDLDRVFSFGARSFSIWTASGQQVYDSGDRLERETLHAHPAHFNATHKENQPDARSDDKGPEPEMVKVARVYGRTLAFIALERIGGVIVYDVGNPLAPRFVTYVNNRQFTGAAPTAAEDLGPEGLLVIPAQESPTRRPLLVVSNEVSGSITVWQLTRR